MVVQNTQLSSKYSTSCNLRTQNSQQGVSTLQPYCCWEENRDHKQQSLSVPHQKYHSWEHKFKIFWTQVFLNCNLYPYPPSTSQDRQVEIERKQWGRRQGEKKSQSILLGAFTEIVYSFSMSASTRTEDAFSGENSTSVFISPSSLHFRII